MSFLGVGDDVDVVASVVVSVVAVARVAVDARRWFLLLVQDSFLFADEGRGDESAFRGALGRPTAARSRARGEGDGGVDGVELAAAARATTGALLPLRGATRPATAPAPASRDEEGACGRIAEAREDSESACGRARAFSFSSPFLFDCDKIYPSRRRTTTTDDFFFIPLFRQRRETPSCCSSASLSRPSPLQGALASVDSRLPCSPPPLPRERER